MKKLINCRTERDSCAAVFRIEDIYGHKGAKS